MSPAAPVAGDPGTQGRLEGPLGTGQQSFRAQQTQLHHPLHGGFLAWRDEWTLDVGFMDEDHRELAAMLSRMARDYGPQDPAASVPSIRRPDAPPLTEALAELAAHTRAHFEREEEVMRVDDFPDLPDHKSEHDLLLAELSALSRELRDSGTHWLSQDLLDSLKDWLLGHVLEMDRELAEFLKNPGRASTA